LKYFGTRHKALGPKTATVPIPATKGRRKEIGYGFYTIAKSEAAGALTKPEFVVINTDHRIRQEYRLDLVCAIS